MSGSSTEQVKDSGAVDPKTGKKEKPRRRSVTFRNKVDAIRPQTPEPDSGKTEEKKEKTIAPKPRFRRENSFTTAKLNIDRGPAPVKTIDAIKNLQPGVCFQAHKIFTRKECHNLVKAAEDYGFESGSGGLQSTAPSKWKAEECTEIAGMLAARLAPMVVKGTIPDEWPTATSQSTTTTTTTETTNWPLLGVNNLFHVCKYDKDSSTTTLPLAAVYSKNESIASKACLVMALSVDEFEGGASILTGASSGDDDDSKESKNEYSADLKAGTMLAFQHDGVTISTAEVTKGIKYLLVSHLMYCDPKAVESEDAVDPKQITPLT